MDGEGVLGGEEHSLPVEYLYWGSAGGGEGTED